MTDYKFHCEKCNFFTNYPQNYKRHLDTGNHNNGKRKDYGGPYKCPDCYYETSKSSNYQKHRLNHHATEEEKKEQFKFYCEYCRIGADTQSIFDKHNESNKHKKYINIIMKKHKSEDYKISARLNII
jgi:hypothetical protein